MADADHEVKAKFILKNRKNANLLIDVLEELITDDAAKLLGAISCLESVFIGYFSQRVWNEKYEAFSKSIQNVFGEVAALKGSGEKIGSNESASAKMKSTDAEVFFAEWSHGKYLHFVKKLIEFLGHEDRTVFHKALDCLMNFLVADYNAIVNSPNFDKKQSYFPNTLFSRIIDGLLVCKSAVMKTHLKQLEKYLEHDDIQFYTLKNLERVINGKSKSISKTDNVKNNIYLLLIKVSSQKGETKDDGFVIHDLERLDSFAFGSKDRKRVFSNTWLAFLRLKLPNEILRKVLTNLHEEVMPYMEDPKVLIDFLTDAYNLEGSLALLALNGLFLLIQNYNLDYPDFFKKLYNLFDANVFEAKHRDRFFTLMDLFLTSSNLPAYLVAAFVKKLARISLRVSPDGIRIVLIMIENLMKRHPSCRVLIHRKSKKSPNEDEPAGAKSDQYKLDEEDPARCKALSSSLWELKTLEHHYCADIQEAVKIFQQPFSKEEKSLDEYLNMGYADLFEKELTQFEKEDSVPMNFQTPDVLFEKSVFDQNVWAFE